MIFKLQKVYLSPLNTKKIRDLLYNPKFWEIIVDDTKSISVSMVNSTTLHQEMVLEVEIDSFGLIKKDIKTIQDIQFTPEDQYKSEDGIEIQIIKVKVESSNQIRKFNGTIKIEEKPGKVRLTFTLEEIGLKDSLIELLGVKLANRRLKRGLRNVLEKVAEYSQTGQLDNFFNND